MDAKEQLSLNVKQLREEHGLTQDALAAKMGATRYVVMNLEKGRGTTLDTLERLAEAFNLDAGDMLKPEAMVASKRHTTEFELDGSDINMDYYEGEYAVLPEYVRSIVTVLAVKLARYFAPDNVSRELLAGRAVTIQQLIGVMGSREHIERVRTMDSVSALKYMQEVFAGLILSA